jgi:hypothetical protein
MANLAPPLPNNLDAERSVLGAVLLDNNALNAAIENLKAEDFFLDQHRRIFTQMIALRESERGIDLVTLTDELSRRGSLESCGGTAYVASLPDGMPRVSNVEHYARIVKEKAVLRSIAHRAQLACDLALNGNGNAAEVLSEIAELCAAPVGTEPVWRTVFHTFAEFEAAGPLSFAINGFLQNDGAVSIERSWECDAPVIHRLVTASVTSVMSIACDPRMVGCSSSCSASRKRCLPERARDFVRFSREQE